MHGVAVTTRPRLWRKQKSTSSRGKSPKTQAGNFPDKYRICFQNESLVSRYTPRYFTAGFVRISTLPTWSLMAVGIPFRVSRTNSVFLITSVNPCSRGDEFMRRIFSTSCVSSVLRATMIAVTSSAYLTRKASGDIC
ncbi:hypothetical protein J6590_001340 [Homalodisca vitripennis]|nr:hypothetical protein J6590_001340 [Homalodisca vitripennis]